ncbi:MAG: phytanoyl-CoA dioxygenase family protein [Lentisphaeria bacterium]|nr:phytanoyl-CoA dioxygenase family protein [Lentisphaeria bacterium]NQZ70059.1 phytanoyl-CoA dioxygenase family protein [Lentisphaeria bacterium]
MSLDAEAFANRPFPALSQSQRYHLEVNGYVILENNLTSDETGRYYEAMKRLDHDFKNCDDPANATIRGCRRDVNCSDHHIHFNHILEAEPEFLEYVTHPNIVAPCEELLGGEVRYEESEAIINSRLPEVPDKVEGFHLGTRHGYGTYIENGLFHCHLVKCITNLTDLGPDDGGTCVIAGSHKLDIPQGSMISAAREDPSLIHQVIAPAGSTLLFSESLVHATGPIRSDNERCIIIAGFVPPFLQAWNGQEPSEEFLETVPEHLRDLLSGAKRYNWKRQFRSL